MVTLPPTARTHFMHVCGICMYLLECTHVLWRRMTSGIWELILDSARLPGLFPLSFPEVLGLQVCAAMRTFLVGSWGFEHRSSCLHSEHFIKLALELVNSKCNTWSIWNLVQCVTSLPGKSFENTDTASFCVPNHHVMSYTPSAPLKPRIMVVKTKDCSGKTNTLSY